MLDGNNIQIGAGRYTQCHGALHRIGAEAAYWGKNAYIVTDETVWGKTGKLVSESLEAYGVAFQKTFFYGASTQRSFNAVAKEIQNCAADIVIGLGGGRVIDIAKGASDVADRRVITAPTCAATCAAFAILYVTYGEDGSIACSQFLKHEISSVLVDLDILTDCPIRYLASGIADAMAKKPEFTFTMAYLGEAGKTATSEVAMSVAGYTYELYFKKALQALSDARQGRMTPLAEDVICSNIMLTGMVSNLSTGGKQLAIAHNFYDAVCCLRKESREKFLHGEIVGLAIPLQMAVNGASGQEIARVKKFLKEIGIPTTLREIGIDDSGASVKELVDYTHKKTIPDNMELYRKIADGIHVMM